MTQPLNGFIDIFVNENPDGNRPHIRGFVKINGVKAEFAAWPNKNGKPGVYDGKITPPREQHGSQPYQQSQQSYTPAAPVDDKRVVGVLAAVIAVFGLLFWAPWESERAKAIRETVSKAQRDALEAECRTPKVVSEVDGLTLYAVQESCRDRVVYFSRSGTSWATTERHGKSSRTVHHQVPNAEP